MDPTVPLGAVHALLGPNGAGKTTAVRIPATLSTAAAGTARTSTSRSPPVSVARFRLACCLCRKPIPLSTDVYALDAEWQRRYPHMRGILACRRCALSTGWSSCEVAAGVCADGHIRIDRRPLRPTAREEMSPLGARLLGIAIRDRQESQARGLPYAFGTAECPTCKTAFAVAPAFEKRVGSEGGRMLPGTSLS
ncbi:ATP-binding cassette domain-containing protein [Embleya sp. NPDC020630]|uniref:ATP-binding cassette domain-containing protein n=1 Tax=Embleya sp. NPDC020630 TaxID=3363979 RepID=UPI0037B1B96B